MITCRACALQFACHPINGSADKDSVRSIIMDSNSRAAHLKTAGNIESMEG